jgi:hypothetical protein
VGKKVRASPDLQHIFSYGLYYELTFNPVGPEFPATGKLNPFVVPRIREAMNYLVDRNYIVSEIMGGLAVPRYATLTPAFPDYARYADVVKQIEKEYARCCCVGYRPPGLGGACPSSAGSEGTLGRGGERLHRAGAGHGTRCCRNRAGAGQHRSGPCEGNDGK